LFLKLTRGNVIHEALRGVLKRHFRVSDGTHVALGCHDNDVYIYELLSEGRSVSLKVRCKVTDTLLTLRHAMISSQGPVAQSPETFRAYFGCPFILRKAKVLTIQLCNHLCFSHIKNVKRSAFQNKRIAV